MGIISATWAQGGALAVLVGWAGSCLVAILTGRLVPRSTLTDVRSDAQRHEERLHVEISDWRAAYLDSEKAREAQTEQVRQLTEVSRTVEQLIRSLMPPERRD